jgi:cell division protein FtsN
VAYAEAAAEYLKLEKKSQPLYRVQVGAYSSRERAEKMKKELSAAGFPAQIL